VTGVLLSFVCVPSAHIQRKRTIRCEMLSLIPARTQTGTHLLILARSGLFLAGMDLLGDAGRGCTPYPWPEGVQGGAIFHDKAKNY
jgi:hypothetical protein